MLEPEGYGEAIGALRFVVAPVKIAGRECQLTVVEIVADRALDRDVRVSFCLPGVAADMSGLIAAMGEAPVNEALDCWDKRVPDLSVAARCHVRPVEFDSADTHTAELSGMPYVVRATIPATPGGCAVLTVAWEHDLYVNKSGARFLMVPTLNRSMGSWRLEAIVIGADASPYGQRPKRALSRVLRWDAAANRGVTFPDLETATCVTQFSGALPFHNLFFPVEKRHPEDREYTSVSGAVLRDETAQRLVSFFDVGFQPVMAVCGAFVRDGFNFETAHVPLSVTERMCRNQGGPLIVKDITPGDPLISCSIGTRQFYIDTTKREKYGGVTWVSAVK